MSEEFDFGEIRRRRLNHIKSSVCDRVETEKKFKVSLHGKQQQFRSEIATTFPGFKFVSAAIKEFKDSKAQDEENFIKIFTPAFQNTGLYLKNKEEESLERFYEILEEIDEESEKFEFRENVEHHLKDLNTVKLKAIGLNRNPEVSVKDKEEGHILNSRVGKKIELSNGIYKFYLKGPKVDISSKRVSGDTRVVFDVQRTLFSKIKKVFHRIF